MGARLIDGRGLAADLKEGLAAEEAEVIATVGKLKEDPRVSGILVLKPLPNCEGERIIR